MANDMPPTGSTLRQQPLPSEDYIFLSGLEPDEVRAAAESRIEGYRAMIEDIKGYIIQLMTIQNTTVPLHATLPPEILMNVFRHVFPSSRSDIRLTHVCKLWYDLIHRTPEFWADMVLVLSCETDFRDHGADSPLSLTTCIARSSPVPYKLNAYQSVAFIATIPSHAMRIYSLCLTLLIGPDYIPQLTTLLDLDMPLLETMQCQSRQENFERWQPGFHNIAHPRPCGNRFPRLRTLTLHGPGLVGRSFAFPSLRELRIGHGDLPEPLDPLLDLLRDCSQLRVLDMIMQQPTVQISPERHTVTVYLPDLQMFTLFLRGSVGPWANNLLEWVRLPGTAQLNITWLKGSDAPLSTLVPTSPPNRLEAIDTIHALDVCYYATVHGCDDSCSASVLEVNGFVPEEPTPRLSLSVHDPCYDPVAQHNVDIVPSRAIVDSISLFSNAPRMRALKINLQHGITMPPEDWLAILDAFPSLTSLTVRIDSCWNLLAVLRKTPDRWPTLQRLSISCKSGSRVHECLLTVAENRARKGLPLQYLAFSGDRNMPLAEHRVRRLRGLVAEVTTADEFEA